MDAIILAGGKGNRMEYDLPKPLVIVRGKSILAHQLEYLAEFREIDRIILALGHRADEIVNFVKKEFSNFKLPIEFSVEKEPLGTGGGIKLALKNQVKSDFALVINCDDITDLNITNLAQNKENMICVAHPRLPFGLVEEKDGYAIFKEKPILQEWVSIGWYLFKRKELLEFLPDIGSLEYDVLPKIKLKLYKHLGFWKALNTKKDILEFEDLKV
ncbi:nucleotidyltransferase family protein [Candidatus Falkowbacteria bacterium]|nr:nucleotidyltransferase family protein [Candidatus Falkowbacteria bacterium]